MIATTRILSTLVWGFAGVLAAQTPATPVKLAPLRLRPAAAPSIAGGSASSAAPTRHQETPTEDPGLDPAVLRLLEEILGAPGEVRDRHGALWRAACQRHGTIDGVLDFLATRVDQKGTPWSERLPAVRLRARLLRRLGDLQLAREMLDLIPEENRTTTDCLSRAEVLDALGDDTAADAYGELLKRDLDDAVRNQVLLRRALITKSDSKDGPSPLAVFAAEDGRDPALRTQAAVVLALQNEQKEAIELFSVTEEPGSPRFRQLVRLAEWAIEAKLWPKAQELAWGAYHAAALKRDRRYALTILVEAYRRDLALDALVQRLATTPDLEDEARQVWIDLLRETGKVDEALRLFREAASGNFTIDMRRQLLEMCREAGKEQVLVEAYTDLIAREPRFIEWREGLSRFHLERGDREAAIAVWRPYLSVTDDLRYRLAAASTMMLIGLDELAVEFARAVQQDPNGLNHALLFLFELHRDRGRLDEAEEALAELDRLAEPGEAVRLEISDAYARLGNKKRAIEILQKLREARGAESTLDAEMKLALLLSEVDEDEQALEAWTGLWRRTESIPRRRYVEERLMTVASRTGALARIAVDLEQKLADGKADDLDSGLLVRIYTRVNDPVSATEVIDEHMKKTGGNPVEVLAEKSRVFLSCNDYFNYEGTIKELIVADSENRADYLRQLAMSNLERGQRDEAREILEQLKKEEAETTSDEFEAGVLSLAGMREEALQAYRRGLARFPDRIDTYLLLSNVMKELGHHDRSAGMFQYLAATAPKDDLFTIAIDGILNMRDGRQNRGAPDRLVEWARRVVLERLASRPDKLYLYQLVSDLSEELKDRGMAVRALKAALPIAGEQRTSLLRELMAMSQTGRPNPNMIFFGTGNSRPIKREENPDCLMFGRRLLGQGELVPPQVYLELGETFLAAEEVVNATRTFNQASQLPEFAELQRQIGDAFERARYPKEALRIYERILTVETSDVALIGKVAELHEQLGRDDVAGELYRRGLELLLARRPFVTSEADPTKAGPDPMMPFGGGNVDDFDTHYEWLMLGFLASTDPGPGLDACIADHLARIDDDLARAVAEGGSPPGEEHQLARFPRLRDRAALLRRLAVAYARPEQADDLDRQLLVAFPEDAKLLEELCRFRVEWGLVVSARRLVADSGRSDDEKKRLRLFVGGHQRAELTGTVPVAVAKGRVLPLIVADREEEARRLLERIDLSTGQETDLEHLPLLVATAAYLRDSERALAICRHWLTTLVAHSKGQLYGPIAALLGQSRVALNPQQRRSLVEHLVDIIVEKPDRFSAFIPQLPELEKIVGAGFLTTKQVEMLITSRLESSDRAVWGIPELFGLIPAKDRSTSLRGIWSKIANTERAGFLLQLIARLDAEVDSDFADFLVGSFESARKDVDNPEMLSYFVDEMVESGGANTEVVRRILDLMIADNGEDLPIRVAHTLALDKMGRASEALQAALAIFGELIGGTGTDWRVTNAQRRLMGEFAEDHYDEFLAVIDEREKRDGASIELTRHRLDLVALRNDAEELSAALADACAAHPKDVDLKNRWHRQLQGRGARAQAAALRADILALKPEDARQRKTLVNELLYLEDPIGALRVMNEEVKKEETEERRAGARKARTPAAHIDAVKKSLDAGDEEAARVTFRRLWRVFPDRSNRFFRYQFERESRRQLLWPPDEEKKDEKEAAEIDRGGFLKNLDEPLQSTMRPDGKNKRRPAQAVLAEFPFGAEEIGRQLRCMGPTVLDAVVANDIYRALTDLDVARLGRQEAIRVLLERESDGAAGKSTYGRLFALLEEAPDDQQTGLDSTLEGLLDNTNPQDRGQLRRLARLYARTGRNRQASALYRWCGMQTSGGGNPIFGDDVGTDRLLEEVIEHLKGEDRDSAINAILGYAAPGPDDYWGRDAYEQMVLSTWERVLGPEAALEKTREICTRITQHGDQPRRMTAKRVAYLMARSGEISDALQALEVALCKLDPPETGLRYSWLRSQFTQPGFFGDQDLRRLFPKDTTGWIAPEQWLLQASARIRTWIEGRRLAPRNEYRILAVLALRLHEAGEVEAADEILTEAQAVSEGQATQLLWVADVARRTGRSATADAIERELLDARCLHVNRVPEVVGRILESEGPEAALDVGTKAAAWTLHPDLIDHLITASNGVNDTEAVRRWTATKAEAAAAKATIEAEREKEKQKAAAEKKS